MSNEAAVMARDVLFELQRADQETQRIYNGIDYSRQLGIVNPFSQSIAEAYITVVGAGAVGSFTVLTLAKMGFRNFTVWDDDVVSSENLPNQFYAMEDVGVPKVQALKRIINMFTGIDINICNERFDINKHRELFQTYTSDPSSRGYSVLIMCTDNMRSRIDAFANWKSTSADYFHEIYIDARMGGLNYQVFMFNRHNLNGIFQLREYFTYPLFDDNLAAKDPCTAKSIIFNVVNIASTIACRLTHAIRYIYGNADDPMCRYYSGEMENRIPMERIFGETIGNLNNCISVNSTENAIKLMGTIESKKS